MSILFWKHNIITELRELTYMSLQLGLVKMFRVESQLLLVKGETEQASSTFKIVLEGNPKNVPMRFLVRHVFSSALTVTQSLWTYIICLFYALCGCCHQHRALQVFPNGPAVVRLGIGLCHYKLGQWDTLESDLDSSCELMNSDTWIASGFGENHLDSTKRGHSAAHIEYVQLRWIRSWRYKEIAGVKVLRLRIVDAIRYTIS
ncbi:hypothetical protein C5167_038070 [Papaver somniferum]|uniref:Uncharacterized protein n=1 Tax=Papaver somniferum TaxID=3469 RepID=A0A4Y7IBC8_PAPSO|nr:hypothetical protein C5167_038070 [Papaver somniferum]